MKNRFLFHLADGWALGADSLQWMLLRARKRHAETVWQPQSYIGSTKAVLYSCMRDKGVNPTNEAKAKLDELPEKFRDWWKEDLERKSSNIEQKSIYRTRCSGASNEKFTPKTDKANG
ncbi:hypothetical protein ACFO8N_10025 [Sneathiella chungangensis]|uniref:hypothetical protein n=1 Tax=Sneathiella chungangensis TaxID=1418234 RepID=UPI001371E5B2|nr:hypothetical protein [Sneathiella chungangensis]